MTGPGLADVDCSLFKAFPITEKSPPAGSRRVLQRSQPFEFRLAECHGVFKRSHQWLGGADHVHCHHVAADTVWTEAFLAARPAAMPADSSLFLFDVARGPSRSIAPEIIPVLRFSKYGGADGFVRVQISGASRSMLEPDVRRLTFQARNPTGSHAGGGRICLIARRRNGRREREGEAGKQEGGTLHIDHDI